MKNVVLLLLSGVITFLIANMFYKRESFGIDSGINNLETAKALIRIKYNTLMEESETPEEAEIYRTQMVLELQEVLNKFPPPQSDPISFLRDK